MDVRLWVIRALRAERRAARAEKELSLTAEIAARAIDKLSDDELLQLRAELAEDGHGQDGDPDV